MIIWLEKTIRLILIFFLGASLGSFGQLVVERGPAADVVFTPSHCATCLWPLTWADLIPIISYGQHHGRCRHCQQPIPLASTLREWLGGLSACWLFTNAGDYQLADFIALAGLFICALADWTNHYVYQRTLLICGGALLLAPFPAGQPHWLAALALTGGFALIARLTQGLGSADVFWLGLIFFYRGSVFGLGALFIANLLILTYYPWREQTSDRQIPFLPYLFVATLITPQLFALSQRWVLLWQGFWPLR
ncbi:prepilin peptidase [Lapidilactobacillus salsurivasis]